LPFVQHLVQVAGLPSSRQGLISVWPPPRVSLNALAPARWRSHRPLQMGNCWQAFLRLRSGTPNP